MSPPIGDMLHRMRTARTEVALDGDDLSVSLSVDSTAQAWLARLSRMPGFPVREAQVRAAAIRFRLPSPQEPPSPGRRTHHHDCLSV